MPKRNREGRTVKMVTVVYTGRANEYINFPTEERPEGFSFQRGVPTDVPAAMLSLIEETGLFERVLPDPEPVEFPSIPDSVVGTRPSEPEPEEPESVPESVVGATPSPPAEVESEEPGS